MVQVAPLKRSHIIALSAAIMCLFAGVFIVWMPVQRGDTTRIEVTIEKGQGLYDIATVLKNGGLIRSKYAFVLYVSLQNTAGNLQAGRYQFTRGMNISSITYRLVEGLAESDDLKLVITEGSNVWDIDEHIAEMGLAPVGAFAKVYYLREGKLFPDTYRIKKDTPLSEVYATLLDTYAKKSSNPDILALITASILEKEAKKSDDMRMIADIIQRRLGRGMLLQIDATVGYGWCLRTSLANNFSKSCDVSQAPIRQEIEIDGAFNSYIKYGLPPRPISNPGRIAIDAAKNPLPNDYFFYLSTRDGSELIYAKTLQEHERNRRRYLGL